MELVSIVCIAKIKKKLSRYYWTSVTDEKLPFNAVIQQNNLYANLKNILFTPQNIQTIPASYIK